MRTARFKIIIPIAALLAVAMGVGEYCFRVHAEAETRARADREAEALRQRAKNIEDKEREFQETKKHLIHLASIGLKNPDNAFADTAGDRAFISVHGEDYVTGEKHRFRFEYLKGDHGWIEVKREIER